MQAKAQTEDRYQRLMTLSQETFEAGEFDTAYHVLAAALHSAKLLENEHFLAEVAERAQEQLAWIDIHVPAYEHSTPSAAGRRHSSIFKLLADQAHVWGHILEHEHKRASREARA